MSNFTIPGMDEPTANKVIGLLQQRLDSFNDLHLTLKHVHWNVVGPNFIAVHEMLDPQVDLVRGFADDVAERIAALGGSPIGTIGEQASRRTWDDYTLGRASAVKHLAALDKVYVGVISDQRSAIEESGELDPITEDLLIGQSAELEKFQWFVRAHLENSEGTIDSHGAKSEAGAAKAAEN